MDKTLGRFLQVNRKAVFTVAYIAILSAAFSIFTFTGALNFVEQKLVDLRFQAFNQNKPVSQDIVFVDIDDPSLVSLSPDFGGWPWARGTVIGDRLIQYIMEGGPSVLLFDILYTEYSSKDFGTGIPEQDMQLLSTSSSYPNVSHGALLLPDEQPKPAESPSPEALESHFYIKTAVGQNPPRVESMAGLVLPYYPLSEDSPSIHLVNRIVDSDGLSRNYNLLYEHQGKYLPSLALTALKFKMGVESVTLEERAMVLNLADGRHRRIDLAPDGRQPLNFNRNLDEFNLINADAIITSAQNVIVGKGEITVPSSAFAGKIVIVGSSAIGLKDQIVTPVGNNVAGPFFHITAISNILMNDSITLVPPYWTALILTILVGLIVVLSLWLKNAVVKNIVGLIPLLFSLLVCLFGFKFAGVMFDMTSIIGAGILAFVGSVVFLSFTEGAEKKKISQAMGKYLAPSVMKEVLERYGELIGEVGEKKDITVLFSDIRGFTSISEAYPPEVVVSVLNDYLEEMIDVVFEHNGTLDKMIGDAIMAFWGAPAADEDKELHAVRTAVAMIRRLGPLNERLRAEGKVELQIGVGVNTGPMIVGNIGSSKRLDYTLIGDNVNLGSRLEGLTKYYKVPIIVSGSTWNKLTDQFFGLSLDSVAVKGKESGVPIYYPMIELNKTDELPAWMADRDAFETVRRHYLAQDFERASTGFQELSASPSRLAGLAEVYNERCRHFLQNPPAKDWDGCWKMLDK